MVSQPTTEYAPSHQIQLISDRLGNSYQKFWQDTRNALDNDSIPLSIPLSPDALDIDQYYAMARLFTLPLNDSKDFSSKLSNFEIRRSLRGRSAEFLLLANPMSSELLDHGFSLYYDQPIEDIRDLMGYTPDIPIYSSFVEDHVALSLYYKDKPELFWRLVLTTNIQRYKPIQQARQNFSNALSDKGIDLDEGLIVTNLNRVKLMNVELHMIEQLISNGVVPLEPEEFYDLIEEYLISLIKNNEDRLNPYASTPDRSRMPGEIALDAFFENRTGKSLPRD